MIATLLLFFATRLNREMIADLIQDPMKHNEGVFPKSNAFIERVNKESDNPGL